MQCMQCSYGKCGLRQPSPTASRGLGGNLRSVCRGGGPLHNPRPVRVRDPGQVLLGPLSDTSQQTLTNKDAPHAPDQPPLRPFCCRESLHGFSQSRSSLPACEEARRPNDFMQACAELCRLDVGVGKRGPPSAGGLDLLCHKLDGSSQPRAHCSVHRSVRLPGLRK